MRWVCRVEKITVRALVARKQELEAVLIWIANVRTCKFRAKRVAPGWTLCTPPGRSGCLNAALVALLADRFMALSLLL